jgi:hypothetical protein
MHAHACAGAWVSLSHTDVLELTEDTYRQAHTALCQSSGGSMLPPQAAAAGRILRAHWPVQTQATGYGLDMFVLLLSWVGQAG